MPQVARHPARRLPDRHVRVDHRHLARRLRALTGETALLGSSPRLATRCSLSILAGLRRRCRSSFTQFARSPYAEQQKLAWTGALILTFAVLGLSIVARVLFSFFGQTEVGSGGGLRMSGDVEAQRPANAPVAETDKVVIRNPLNLYYGATRMRLKV